MQVAACELLHSLVVYMVGKSAQMVEGGTSLPPMYKLHKRLFPVLLRLACDVDQVCADLFFFIFFLIFAKILICKGQSDCSLTDLFCFLRNHYQRFLSFYVHSPFPNSCNFSLV